MTQLIPCTQVKPTLNLLSRLPNMLFDNVSTQHLNGETFYFGHAGAMRYLLNPKTREPVTFRGFHTISIGKNHASIGATDYRYDEHVKLVSAMDAENSSKILIKLCKAHEPEQALKQYYEENYLASSDDNQFYACMVGLLSKIVEEHIPFSLSRLINEMNPKVYFDRESDTWPFEKAVFLALMYKIRHTAVKDIKFSYVENGL